MDSGPYNKIICGIYAREGLLRVECQLINVQGMMELGNYHLVTSMDNKTSEWKCDEEQDIYLVLKCLSTKYLLITRENW